MRNAAPSLRMRARAGRLPLVCVIALAAVQALRPVAVAAEPDASSRPSSLWDAPLEPLPKPPPIALATPREDELEALDGLLSRITDADPTIRKTAVREILELPPTLVPAIDRRIDEIADRSDRSGMKKTLRAIRKRARRAERERMRAAGKKGKVETPDYLVMLVDFADTDSEPWRDLTRVVTMSRILERIGTVEAARELVRIYVRFGELLRVDTQLMLQKLGDRALAALIEARRHPALKIGRWANRQLDMLGKAIPSEAVQTDDQQVLADVLRAFGRTQDPDAARIIISFANSERAQIREAARQGVAMMGEPGNWQLRDTYEQVVGKKPPRDWAWSRTARELFRRYDGLRLARVHQLFSEGNAARAAGNLTAMKSAYDKVLARSPSFGRRGEMAGGYLDYGRRNADTDPDGAVDALRRAERIAGDDRTRDRAKSLRLTLEAESLLERGVADRVLYRRAIELDASNERARSSLARLQRGEVERQSTLRRYLAAGAIALTALLAVGLIGLRRGRRGNDAERAASQAPRGDGPES